MAACSLHKQQSCQHPTTLLLLLLLCCSEELKRRNESLKQAIGLFLDQPSDVGAITGKPTGTWDEGSTATLLEQLRRQRTASGLGSTDEDSSPKGTVENSFDEAQKELKSGPYTQRPASTAAADGSNDLQVLEGQQPWKQVQQQVGLEQLADRDALPLGPVFDTSMPGALWQEAAAAEAAAAAAAAAEAAAAEAAEEAAAAAAEAAVADTAAAAADAETAAKLKQASSAAAVSTPAAAPDTASSNGVPPAQAAAAAVAAPALAPPGAAPSSSSSSRTSLGSIHERVEAIEQQHEREQQQQAKRKQKQAMKPRATGEVM
jgi:hypothetical protein